MSEENQYSEIIEGEGSLVSEECTENEGCAAETGDVAESAGAVSQEKPVYCPHCGKKQNGAGKFCASCGKPLGQAFENTRYEEQRYSTEDDIEALYVKKNTEYFLPRFRSMRISGGKVKWNWAAFFVTPLWMIYRRMYTYGFGLLFVQLVLTLLGVGGLSILISIYFGLMGNHLYMKHIEKLMGESRSMTDAARSEHLEKYGGTSGKAVWITIVVYIILGAILI